jgi:hypothetical protein
MMRLEEIPVYLKVLSCNLPEMTEKNHDNPVRIM